MDVRRPRTLARVRPRFAVDVSAARGFAAHAAAVRRAARRALPLLVAADAELSIGLVGDAEIQALNRDYRGKDRPTDVLAFAQREGEESSAAALAAARAGAGGAPRGASARARETPELLGDIVISVPTAARQAQRRGRTLAAELETLLVHGLLHLLGYDHERSPAEARRMFRKAREIETALHPIEPARQARTSDGAAVKERRHPRSRRRAGGQVSDCERARKNPSHL